MKYDVIILGAGPAGLTAGLYAARSGLKTGIISKDIGGTANYILLLENWPGFKGTGEELMKQFYEQMKEYDAEFIMGEVESVEKKGKEFLINMKKKQLETRAIIIATGTERRKLGIKGERELTGKGVSYCATCDGFFFRNKIVGVVGGSDCAATSALALADLAKHVYIYYRGQKLRCEDVNSERLKNRKNVSIIYNAVPKEILGSKKVEGIKMEIEGKEQEFKLDGVFVEIGAVPIIDITKKVGLKVDKENYIIINEYMNTSVPGIFAAGDVTNHRLKQVVVASSQGAIAAKSAYEFLLK